MGNGCPMAIALLFKSIFLAVFLPRLSTGGLGKTS